MANRILICTDLDRTLLPNGVQQESPGARESFARLVAREEITLAYVSGRDRELIAAAINEYNLPVPDWIIGDVGTSIYRVDKGEWRRLLDWEEDISTDWLGLKANDLRPLFKDLVLLRLQEEAKQNTYKLSYYLPIRNDFGVLWQEMTQRLDAHNLNASLIYSVDEASCTGLLDVLPGRATKRHAVEFLMQHLGFDCTNTVFAGDSGNDLPVIISPIPSILVANAAPEVVEQAKVMATEQGTMPALYVAQGGFKGMNGNYSAGILEGIAHYHPYSRIWMANS